MSEAIATFAVAVYRFLLPLSWIALIVAVIVLVPMAAVKNTRAQAGFGFFIASWIFGLTTWMLGAAVTFSSYGFVGLFIGVILFGVGVVPIGIFAAFFALKNVGLGLSLIIMSVVVYAARMGGAVLAASGSERA